MHRVKPDYWHYPHAEGREPFCKYADEDRKKVTGHLLLVIDPRNAIDYWEEMDFPDVLPWARAGFPGVFVSKYGDVWILSPDPGKEIDGDS